MTTQDAPRRRLVNVTLDRLDILVLGVLIGLCLGAVGTSLYFHFRTALPDLADWLDSVLQNAGTEMFGAFLTFALIEVIVRKRREGDAEQEQQRREVAARELAIAQEKERLILQMGSPDHGFAVEAARILQARGWGFGDDTTLKGVSLRGGNLQGVSLERANLREVLLSTANLQEADLQEANLHGADLKEVNLQGASLNDVNLQEAELFRANLQEANLGDANLHGAILNRANMHGTNLRKANLQKANLSEANLQEASLGWANLQEAHLWGANLQGAILSRADLHGADLMHVDLRGADLSEANLESAVLRWKHFRWAVWESEIELPYPGIEVEFDIKTTLPDGSKWSPNTDMERFTDPRHPHFWRSDNPYSPAYRGGKRRAILQLMVSQTLEERQALLDELMLSDLLHGLSLEGINLPGVNLNGANLQGTNLSGANLQGANLSGANLQGTILWGANLKGVSLEGAEFDEKTIFSDYSHWTPDADLTRFTDPEHPDSWRAIPPWSSFYRGEESDDDEEGDTS